MKLGLQTAAADVEDQGDILESLVYAGYVLENMCIKAICRGSRKRHGKH